MTPPSLRYAALNRDEKRVVDHWIGLTRGDLSAISPMVLGNLRESGARSFKENPESAVNMIAAYDRAQGTAPTPSGRSH